MNANEMTEQAAQKAKELQQRARELKDQARDWTEKAKKKAKTTARDAAAAADLYVHEYTWTTFAIVAVTAAALGFMLGRSRS
jgi:ElaB/YqjD/DUF883 family membrane-anchored ribosome-binding protein